MTAPREIRAPARDLPRYCPGRAFPAYRFVPGLHPHPRRAGGHSFEVAEDDPPGAWSSRQWRTLSPWLHGVDLFNHFYFWEAHESWEILWAQQQRASNDRFFLQGLIQIAAALLKVHLGSINGARTLSRAGTEKLKRVSQRAPAHMGLSLGETIDEMESYFRPLAMEILPILDANVPALRLATEWTPGDAP